MLDALAQAISSALSWQVLWYLVIGVFIGYLVGALPGMNRTTAIALLLPFTVDLSPLVALSFLIGINKGGAAGSAVSAILINVPGEPSSVVTTLDGYPMSRQGKSRKALQIGLIASVLGDLFATMVLIVLTAPLAKIALGTGPIELSALLIFTMTFIAAASGTSFYKGILSGLMGLLLATVGLDPETGLPRLTFGYLELQDGIPLLAVAIGTLALAEIFVQTDRGRHGMYDRQPPSASTTRDDRLSFAEFKAITPAIFKGSIVGIGVGILPGLGATLSSFLGYNWVKRTSKTPELFGAGAPEGVAASESADNASVPGSLVPVFAIGLPGSLSTALLMGAFMMHGITPGPFLLRDDSALVYGIFIAMMLASVVLLVVGYFGQQFFSKIILAGDRVILPIIVFFCFLGAYLESASMFSVFLMLGFAVAGYLMKKFDYSFVTFVVGYVLGPMAELSFRQAAILSDGNPMALLNHPFAIFFLVLAVFSAWRLSKWNAQALAQVDAKVAPRG
jgi:putative tricarboxylic transport membrane protein